MKEILEINMLKSKYFQMQLSIIKNLENNKTKLEINQKFHIIYKNKVLQNRIETLERCKHSTNSRIELITNNKTNTSILSFEQAKNLRIDNRNNQLMLTQPHILFNRFFQSYNAIDGRIVIEVWNRENDSQTVLYSDVLDSNIKIYFHTTKAYINNKKKALGIEYFEMASFTPSNSNRIQEIDLKFRIEAKTNIFITIEYEIGFLEIKYYEPNTGRGFFVGSAKLHAIENNEVFYSKPALLNFPVTDSTMPYNVITITFTVFALLYGALYQIFTKNLVLKE